MDIGKLTTCSINCRNQEYYKVTSLFFVIEAGNTTYVNAGDDDDDVDS